MEKKRFRWGWHIPVLIGILLVTAVLNVYQLSQEGYGNEYYAAAVKSMMQSWHNFFFVSFDPGGYITVDKPPVAFWLQTVSALVFGFHGWSLILPQALSAVVSVWLLYKLVTRKFGRVPALLAALVLALTPILAAVSRTNNVDSLLVLTVLIATWFLDKAVENGQGRLKYLLLAAVMIGVGFNIKMLEAYMVLPAFFLLYVIAPKISWKKKVAHLAAAAAVLLVVSFSWAVIVDSIPASERPYVGSSQTNSEIELSLGYNGVERWTKGMPGMKMGNRMDGQGQGQNRRQGWNQGGGGQFPGGMTPPNWNGQGNGSGNGNDGSRGNGGNWQGMQPPNGFPPGFAPGDGQMPPFGNRGDRSGDGRRGGQGGFGGPGGGGPGGMNTGQAGVLRLFQIELSGQTSWLFPLVGFGLVALLARPRGEEETRRKRQFALFFGAWLLPMMIFFSFAGFFHPYYLVMMAPAIAALAGLGLVQMWQDFRAGGWRRWLLPLAVVATVAFEASIVYQYPTFSNWLMPAMIGAGVLALFALAVLLFKKVGGQQSIAVLAGVTGLVALLIAPAAWSATPMLYGGNEAIPSAGPDLQHSKGMMVPGSQGANVNTKLIDFLMKDYQAGTYLLAVTNANSASPIILQTGLPVMAMGGFIGSDPAITVDQLAAMAKAGKVKYFMTGGMGGPGGQNNAITQWIEKNCKEVPTSEWQSTSTNNSKGNGFMNRGMEMGGKLYEYVGK